MKSADLYGRVRFAVQREGLSHREAGRRFGIDPRTVAKMMRFSVPPGYRRSEPAKRPKMDQFVGVIDTILGEDKLRPAKQRHTSKRNFERLRDEHGFAGGITIVKDYVLGRRQRMREMFVPLLSTALAQEDAAEARDLVRGLVEAITLIPEDGKLRIEVRGELGAILSLASGAKNAKSPRVEAEALASQVKLVAGKGNHRELSPLRVAC